MSGGRNIKPNQFQSCAHLLEPSSSHLVLSHTTLHMLPRTQYVLYPPDVFPPFSLQPPVHALGCSRGGPHALPHGVA